MAATHFRETLHQSASLPVLFPFSIPCQIITPLVEIAIWLPNPNPTPNPKPTLTLNLPILEG